MPDHIVVQSHGPRMFGEDVEADDDFKRDLYPYADRIIVELADGPDVWAYTRAHLLNPTVFLVAAVSHFTATKDRERGVKLLRTLADLLENQRLGDIPWGPKNPAHKPVLRELAKRHLGRDLDEDQA